MLRLLRLAETRLQLLKLVLEPGHVRILRRVGVGLSKRLNVDAVVSTQAARVGDLLFWSAGAQRLVAIEQRLERGLWRHPELLDRLHVGADDLGDLAPEHALAVISAGKPCSFRLTP